jgi:hypothetical protein
VTRRDISDKEGNMDTELEMKKIPKTAAERAKAYRDRKRKNKPMTTEENIRILESKLRDPDISARDMATLTRKINLLKGIEATYDRRPVAERKPIAPPEPEQDLPHWWNDVWCRVFLIESLNGTRPIQRYAKEMTRYWDSLSDEEKQELQAEAQRFRETRNAAESAGDSK